MSNPGFTPGPWAAERAIDGSFDVVSDAVVGRESFIAQVSNESAPNARLIAAAPDLYHAAQSVLKRLNHWDANQHGYTHFTQERRALEAAIAKAQGKETVTT